MDDVAQRGRLYEENLGHRCALVYAALGMRAISNARQRGIAVISARRVKAAVTLGGRE
jgi:hypothetical protein